MIAVTTATRWKAVTMSAPYPSDSPPDIYEPSRGDDPYETYRLLRAHFPILLDTRRPEGMYPHAQMGTGDRYLVSRFTDIHGILRDHENFSNQRRGTLPPGPQPSREEWRGNLIGDDPPRHGMIRQMVGSALTPRSMLALEPVIRRTVVAMIEGFDSAEGVDFAPRLAIPLPLWMIAYLLGVDDGEMEHFRKWSFASDPQHWRIYNESRGTADSADPEPERTAALAEFYEYFDAAVEARLDSGVDDLVSRLAAGQQKVGEDAFTRQELLQVIHLLLLGGNETTANLLTLVFNKLADEPGLWTRMRGDRSLVDKVVEETMRWDSPVQSIGRRVVRDTEIGGVAIAAESSLVLLLGSANRDERVFDRANQFALDREASHIGFGFGIHFCVGAPVTRLEVAIVLNELLDRYATMERTGEAKLAGTAPLGLLSESRRLRGYGQLPLRFSA
jgi:cytochrome P450